MRHVVAQGVWCPKCEFFENQSQDDLNGASNASCVVCGCSAYEHDEVEVITVDDGLDDEPDGDWEVDD